jgi:hypothetical protein
MNPAAFGCDVATHIAAGAALATAVTLNGAKRQQLKVPHCRRQMRSIAALDAAWSACHRRFLYKLGSCDHSIRSWYSNGTDPTSTAGAPHSRSQMK